MTAGGEGIDERGKKIKGLAAGNKLYSPLSLKAPALPTSIVTIYVCVTIDGVWIGECIY
jgi:hypothetical protein